MSCLKGCKCEALSCKSKLPLFAWKVTVISWRPRIGSQCHHCANCSQDVALMTYVCPSKETLVLSGRPVLLSGYDWRNPTGPGNCVWGPRTGRPAIQSPTSCVGWWSEGQWSWGAQQQRVWTWMSCPGSWVRCCIVSFSVVGFCERRCLL